MANNTLFPSLWNRKKTPPADAVNEALGRAYQMEPKAALAQMALTSCLNDAAYSSAEKQLAQILELTEKLSPEFIAKVAIFARSQGNMKDLPSLLTAVLAVRDVKTLKKIFPRTIDNGKMLRNFVQILRSGALKRKSLGTAPKRLVQSFIDSRSEAQLLNDSVGSEPSLRDVIRMVHPRPQGKEREALYGYIAKGDAAKAVPPVIAALNRFRSGETKELPNVPFQLLTASNLNTEQWALIAQRVSWQTLRMNVNTFLRHGVFGIEGMTKLIAKRLTDREAILKSKAMPYQVMTAMRNVDSSLPQEIYHALEVALEISLRNVPRLDAKVVIAIDLSGSMLSPISGYRKGATSKTTCVEVAALFAAALLKQSEDCRIIGFADQVKYVQVHSVCSIGENIARLTGAAGGGTNCSAPLQLLNREKAKADLVIYLSDNQSWSDSVLTGAPSYGGPTQSQREWVTFKSRNPRAKLACIDLQPYANAQVRSDKDVLNYGGFSDNVFEILSRFVSGKNSSESYLEEIERIQV